MIITLQIGNSDDKLTQKEWSQFFTTVDKEVNAAARQIHFTGTSAGHSQWQDACWVFELNASYRPSLRAALQLHRMTFRQDSIAWTEGETTFIG
jgi:hypothetical protein